MPDWKNLKVETLPKEKTVDKIIEDQAEDAYKLPQPLDKELLINHIEAFANSRKDDGKMVEFSIFHERAFDLEGNKITFILDNEMQVGQFGLIRPVLINHLRSIYGHGFVAESVVNEANQKKMVYSQSDKFKYLAEQYPDLTELKQRLGLEIEF